MLQESRYAPFVDVVWPQTGLLRDALLILGGSVLLAATARLTLVLPFSPVPITGQTFGVLLLGALLGSQRGALSVLAYLAEGTMGMPVFAGGIGGPAVLLGPTGGYLAGFVAAVFLVGWLCERGWDRRLPTAAAAMALGNLVIYLFGVAWLVRFVGSEQVLAAGVLPFIPGDLLKIGAAALLLPAGWTLMTKLGVSTHSAL